MAVDLHIHSKASSDGEFSAKELVGMAKQIGLEAIAITDHDTVAAVEEGQYWGKQYNLEVIPGCEISTTQGGKYLHMLGYYIDHSNQQLLDFFAAVRQERLAVVDRQLEILRNAGFYIEKNDVMAAANEQIPLPSLYAQAMFEDRRNEGNLLLEKFRGQEKHLLKFSVEYLIPGQEFNAPEYIPEAREVLKIIFSAGGIPVLAHPGATLTRNDNQVIVDLLDLGLVGLEAYSSWHSQEQQEYYADYCQTRNLLVTSGSDFHGKMKPEIAIGSARNNSYQVVRNLQEIWRKSARNKKYKKTEKVEG